MRIKVLKEFVTGDDFTIKEHLCLIAGAVAIVLFFGSLLSVETDSIYKTPPAVPAFSAGVSFPLNEVAPGVDAPRADDSTP